MIEMPQITIPTVLNSIELNLIIYYRMRNAETVCGFTADQLAKISF